MNGGYNLNNDNKNNLISEQQTFLHLCGSLANCELLQKYGINRNRIFRINRVTTPNHKKYIVTENGDIQWKEFNMEYCDQLKINIMISVEYIINKFGILKNAPKIRFEQIRIRTDDVSSSLYIEELINVINKVQVKVDKICDSNLYVKGFNYLVGKGFYFDASEDTIQGMEQFTVLLEDQKYENYLQTLLEDMINKQYEMINKTTHINLKHSIYERDIPENCIGGSIHLESCELKIYASDKLLPISNIIKTSESLSLEGALDIYHENEGYEKEIGNQQVPTIIFEEIDLIKKLKPFNEKFIYMILNVKEF